MQSCSKEEGPIIVIPPDTTGSGVDSISFANDIQPIFNSSCTGCHNNTHPQLDLSDGYAYNQLWTDGANVPYVDTVNAEQSILYVRATTDMPPSGALQSFETDKILKWIQQGAKNN